MRVSRFSDSISTLFNYLIDKSFAERENISFTEYRDSLKLKISKVDVTKKFESYFALFWYSSLPCYDIRGITSETKGETSILKSCQWKGVQVSCSSVFKRVVTDQGMCCAFNKDSAEEIFEESRYTKTIRELELEEQKLSFDSSGEIFYFLNLILNWFLVIVYHCLSLNYFC